MSAQLDLWEMKEVREVNDRLTRVEVNQDNLIKTVEANR